MFRPKSKKRLVPEQTPLAWLWILEADILWNSIRPGPGKAVLVHRCDQIPTGFPSKRGGCPSHCADSAEDARESLHHLVFEVFCYSPVEQRCHQTAGRDPFTPEACPQEDNRAETDPKLYPSFKGQRLRIEGRIAWRTVSLAGQGLRFLKRLHSPMRLLFSSEEREPEAVEQKLPR